MPRCPLCSSELPPNGICPSCHPPAPPSRDGRIGCVLPGGYVIQELIGSGGMACVYRAEQTNLGRTVAVKIVHSHLVGDEATARRFIREARAASRLNHPHSLAVIDFGRTQDGQYYLVMEYVRGRDLARVVAEDGLLAIPRVISIVRQLLDVLSEAHQLGIVHRDLKPDNIIVEQLRTGEDFIKVVDFGLAKLLSTSDDVSITAAGTVCGTPDYMSPEQCRGDALDPRSDLYSVGVILFVLLTGRLPFEAPTPTQALLRHLTAAPPDPRTLVPDRNIPDDLVATTLRALEKNRADRFQSAQEFAEALAATETVAAPSLEADGRNDFARCPNCKHPVRLPSRFCGDCGAPLRPSPPAAHQAPLPAPAPEHTPGTRQGLVGRDREIATLLGALQSMNAHLEPFLVVGEPGTGRTSLVRELAARAARRGHIVVRVEPDPWRAGVAWHALRCAVRGLADLPLHDMVPPRWPGASASARAGLSMILHPGPQQPPPSSTPAEVRRSAADALHWAATAALQRARDAAVVLIIDDLDGIDGVSRNAFIDFAGRGCDGPVLVVASSSPAAPFGLADPWTPVTLDRLDPERALSIVENLETRAILAQTIRSPASALFVTLAARFVEDGGGVPPSSLGDLVTSRIALLSRHQRRVLQIVAVLGDGARTDQIARLVGDGTPVHHAARELVESGLLGSNDAAFHVSHPLLRDLVLSTMPAAAARQLYEAAAELAAEESFPMEVRARYALAAGDAFGALLLLDRIGALALQCDDADGAVDFFRMGLTHARAQVGRGELDDPDLAVVMFGRKLGDALAGADRYDEAEQILREMLDIVEPASTEHARVLLTLARVARATRRVADAARYRHDALLIAQRADDPALAAEIARLQI